jgi:hypothetical protein
VHMYQLLLRSAARHAWAMIFTTWSDVGPSTAAPAVASACVPLMNVPGVGLHMECIMVAGYAREVLLTSRMHQKHDNRSDLELCVKM